jgi:hypothetical protein
VAELWTNGIAATSDEKSGLETSLIHELNETALLLAEGKQRARNENNPLQRDFVLMLLGEDIIQVEKSDVFSIVALHPTLLAIADAYLGCYARLTHYDLWLNLPSGDKPKSSQLCIEILGIRKFSRYS